MSVASLAFKCSLVAALCGNFLLPVVADAQVVTLCRSNVAYDVALPACDSVISGRALSGADLASAYYVRSQIFAARNDADRQLTDLDDALRLDRANVLALIARGKLMRARKTYDRARADFDAAIATDPKNADAFYQNALLARDRGDADQAISDWTRSLDIDPSQASAYANRGALLRDQKKFNASLADFEAAVKLAPKDQTIEIGRGRTLGEMKDTAGALAVFSGVIALNPNNAYAYFQRAYFNRRDRQQALADYNETIRINPKSVFAYYNRGSIKRGLKDWDGAIADYNRAIELDPTYAAAFTSRGLAYEAKNDIERAKADFNAALATPQNSDRKWAKATATTRLATLFASVPRSADGDLFGAATEKPDKVALVIGNGAYQHIAKLPNPASDAKAIATSLRSLGFSVVEGVDLDRRGMDEKIVAFLRSVPSAKVALVFYAGHGVQIDGRNYLVPVEVSKIARATLSFDLVDVDRILSGLDDESRANIVILDACRDDPLQSRTAGRSAGERGGLAAYSDVASGMLIAFATAPGKTANDGTGKNSPFTTALLRHLQSPVEVNEMLRQVRVDVFNETKKQQLPWANSSLLGQVYLSGTADRKNN